MFAGILGDYLKAAQKSPNKSLTYNEFTVILKAQDSGNNRK